MVGEKSAGGGVEMSNTADSEQQCSCKIGKDIDRYGLAGLNEDLQYRRNEEDASLRALADHINKRILDAVLSQTGTDLANVAYGAVSADDALEAVYKTLTSDDVPADREARVRKRFEQTGVDIEEIESHWVTHPTVRAHFNDCLDIDTARTTRITAETARNTIEWARTRCSRVVAQTISRLSSAELVAIGDAKVSVMIQITCSKCGSTYRFSTLLKEGTCACHSDENAGSTGQ